MDDEFEISEAVQKQIGDSAVAAMKKYQEEHLDERLKKSDSEMKVLREKMDEINKKSDQIRQETAFKVADNDVIRQGLRANIAYEVMKRIDAKAGKSIDQYVKAQQKIVKSLYPQLERKYKYDPVYMHCKTIVADNYKLEKSELFKSNTIEVEKADMASATAGAGAEFLVTVYSAELTRFTAEMAPIAGKFRTITVPGGKYNKKKSTGMAGEGTYPWSAQGAAAIAENTNHPTTSNIKTGEVNWSTNWIKAYHTESYEFNIESVINAVAEAERELSLQTLRQRDWAVVNGAITETDVYVSGGIDANNFLHNIDGLRQVALGGSANTQSTGAFDFSEFRGVRQKMGLAGDIQDRLFAAFSRGAFYDVLDSIQDWQTVGPAASIITGAVAKLDGITDVFIGGYAMNGALSTAAGKFDTATPANNTQESVIIANRDGFLGVQNGGLQFINNISVINFQLQFGSIYGYDFQKQAHTPENGEWAGLLYDIDP